MVSNVIENKNIKRKKMLDKINEVVNISIIRILVEILGNLFLKNRFSWL